MIQECGFLASIQGNGESNHGSAGCAGLQNPHASSQNRTYEAVDGFFMVTGVLQGTSAYRVLVGIQGFFLGFA